MMSRKIDAVIEHHFETTGNALYLTGARQVGKSFAVEKYARKRFGQYVECNFYKEPELIDIVKSATSEKDLLSKLSLCKMLSFKEGETFIFFDEIQISAVRNKANWTSYSNEMRQSYLLK